MRAITNKLAEFFQVASTLSPKEQAELDRCVETVRRGLRSYLEAGEALATIRDKQLYRTSYQTFEQFANGEFGLTSRRLSQLIESFEIVKNLKLISPNAPTPKVEAAVRPLAGLTPIDQVEAYLEAVEVADGEAPTPNAVKAAAAKRKAKKVGKSAKSAKPVRFRVPGATVIVEPNKAFESVEACLLAALDQVRQSSKAAA